MDFLNLGYLFGVSIRGQYVFAVYMGPPNLGKLPYSLCDSWPSHSLDGASDLKLSILRQPVPGKLTEGS